jgi:arylsulfatase A
MNRTIIHAACALFATLVILDAGEPTRPNILYILTDDLGYGDVHCLNPTLGKIKTPFLDQLATQSLIFTDAHSGSSVCSPSRYGILTGRYAWRTCLQQGVLNDESPPLIAADRLTVPKLLKAHGYQTAGFGKWHLGWEPPIRENHIFVNETITNGPVTRGFDTYFCSDFRLFAPFMFVENDRYAGKALIEWTTPGAKHGKGTPLKPDDFSHILPTVCDHAIECLNTFAQSGKPFFIYLAPCAPHDPFVPTDAWKGKSGLGKYADYVMETDNEIGRVLTALDKTGLASNTLVFLASDNGCAPYAGVKGMEAAGHFPSAGLRGYKSDIWDGGHHVPFMVRWPGVVKPGTSNSQTVCLNDLIATCAEILGDKLPDNTAEDSVSLLPLLQEKAPHPGREAVVHHSIFGAFAIRDGNWKLEFCPGSGGWSAPKPGSAAEKGLPPIQLYDLAADAAEKKNVQAENPAVVQRLTALMEKYVADGRSTPGAPQKNDVNLSLKQKEPPSKQAAARIPND